MIRFESDTLPLFSADACLGCKTDCPLGEIAVNALVSTQKGPLRVLHPSYNERKQAIETAANMFLTDRDIASADEIAAVTSDQLGELGLNIDQYALESALTALSELVIQGQCPVFVQTV